MNPQDVAELARLFRETYSWEALDPGVSAATLQDGAVVLPRDQMWEPLRSFKLIDAVATGPILLVMFTWADGEDDDTVYLMPLDMRSVPLEMGDPISVDTFLSHHLEWTLGGPRDAWARRTVALTPHLVLVRSWYAPDPSGSEPAEEYPVPTADELATAQWFVADYSHLRTDSGNPPG